MILLPFQLLWKQVKRLSSCYQTNTTCLSYSAHLQFFFFFFNVKLKVRLVWLGSSRSLITNQNSTKVSWGGKKKYRSHDKHLFLKNWKKWKHFLHSFVFSLLHNFFRSIKITYQEEFCFCFSFLLIFITKSKTDPFFESVRTAGTAQQPWYTLERYQNNG